MDTSNNYFYRNTILLSFFTLILVAFAIIFYKERIIFPDTAGYIIDIVKDHKMVVMTNRFISIASQVFPYLALELNMPLKYIIGAYSLNMIFIPLITILVSMFWFKEIKTAASILLFYTLMSTYLFYYPAGEFQMGLCVLLFYNGLFDYYEKKEKFGWLFYIVSVFFVLIIVFSHPVSILVFWTWCCWKWIEFSKYRIMIAAGIVFSILFHVIKQLFFKANYDDERSKGAENFLNFSFSYLKSNLSTSFFDKLISTYLIVPLLFVIIITTLIYQRKYFLSFFFILVLFAFWTLVTVSFQDSFYNYYYEHLYQPISFFVAFFFCQYVLSQLKGIYVQVALFIILSISILGIYEGRKVVQDRQDLLNSYLTFIKEKGIRKAILSREFVSKGGDMNSYWSAPGESLLLSSLEGPENSSSLFFVWNVDNLGHDEHSKDSFFMDGWSLPQEVFPKKYFQLPHEEYVILNKKFEYKVILDAGKN